MKYSVSGAWFDAPWPTIRCHSSSTAMCPFHGGRCTPG